MDFLKNIDGKHVFTSNKYKRMEFILPTSYVDSVQGTLNVLGIGKIKVYSDLLGENLEDTYALVLPVRFNTEQNEVMKEEDDTILIYYNDANFILDNKYVKDVDNTQAIFDMMTAGKVKGVPYDKMYNIYTDSMKFNDMDLNNPFIIYEIFVAESCRSVKDATVPHRLDLDNDYVTFNSRVQASLSSGNMAGHFEDIDTSFISTLDATKRGKKSKQSKIYPTIFK